MTKDTDGRTQGELAADLLWAVCGSCAHERQLDRPVTEPGALFLEHAVFVPVAHQPGDLPHRRETCAGSLAPASSALVPLFSSADEEG